MSLLPRSLLARSVLLIATILIVSQIAWIQFYRLSSARSQSEQLASNIANVLNTVSIALETMPAAARRKFSEKLPAMQNIRLLPATSLDVDELATASPLLAAVGTELKRRSGGTTQALAVLEDTDHSMWIKIKVKQQAYWVVFPPDAFGLRSAAAWVGWSLVTLALALAGGFALMMRVNLPLRALARAAADIAAGKTPPALPEKGPSEIRTLSQAFNRMSTALQAQENNRAVLLAGVSHDLRTPLSRLRLAQELSRSQLPDFVNASMVSDIEEMDVIIDQFLDFARDGTNEAVNPHADLNALVEALAQRYEKRGEPVTARFERLPPLRLRPLAVQRMVSNLVDNALRYGGGPVEIETQRTTDGVVLRVLDRGPGIPPEEVERVMQPFTRLDDARTDSSGAGLGLAIVDRVARLHGGKVELIPRPGGGLEARVELPVTPPQGMAPPDYAAVARSRNASDTEFRQ